MPDQRQIIIEPIVSENKAKGSRNQGNLNSIFSNSPIYTELSDKERLSTFMSLTKGEILNGNGISFFDTRYVGNEKNPVPWWRTNSNAATEICPRTRSLCNYLWLFARESGS